MHDHIWSEGLEPFYFRFDVYFLPSASTQGCVVHYEAEKATRGNSAQVLREAQERLELDANAPPGCLGWSTYTPPSRATISVV